ncbi:MAG TPA: hypothetical protein VL463_04730 [Kofleriaceae bacterium]|jgi:hypothetical protein|nr:hypothetical protein [Kofleriaceae bacterium]
MRILIFATFLLTACGSDEIDSNEAARRAYLGLDKSIQKSLTLGFDGFYAGSNANIATQMAPGDSTGTLTISGHVDAGQSNNKQMHLNVGMVMYSDGAFVVDDKNDKATITYDTSTDVTMQPELGLSLHNFPNGTYDGTMVNGTYHLSGDIKGDATLNLTLTGELMDDGTGKTVRKPGTTVITGTATNADGGSYTINVTI